MNNYIFRSDFRGASSYLWGQSLGLYSQRLLAYYTKLLESLLKQRG